MLPPSPSSARIRPAIASNVAGSAALPGRYDRRPAKSRHVDSSNRRACSRTHGSSRSRHASSLSGLRLTPRTRQPAGSSPAAAMSYSDGTSLRLVRSPDAPKMTTTHGSGSVTMPP
jgi:hypothetical protein